MSDAASTDRQGPHGTGLLPRRLTEAELDGAPKLASLDDLVIEDLGDDEYSRFLEALSAE
jgi:hypothetical protein